MLRVWPAVKKSRAVGRTVVAQGISTGERLSALEKAAATSIKKAIGPPFLMHVVGQVAVITDTVAITLIRMFIDGPEVSLKVANSVPTTAAA